MNQRPGLRLSTFTLAAAAAVALLAAAGCNSQPAVSSASTAALPPAAPLAAPAVHSVDAFLQTLPAAQTPPLNQIEAMTLASYPLSCLDHLQDQPGAAPASAPTAVAARGGRGNNPAAPAARGARGAYLWQPAGPTHLLAGYNRQRSFYGCYDWHSAVNSTWTLVTLLRRYPDLPLGKLIREKLNGHLGKPNLAGELAFFQGARAFERPYGQAWVLKLYGELLSWNDPDAKKWAANLAPFANFLSKNLAAYLTKLPTPVRQGVHPNTAFDMDLMLPYTAVAHDEALHKAIVDTSLRFYRNDRQCPTAYEPEGVSFLSPCLVEGALMAHVLNGGQFLAWFNNFMPAVYASAFQPLVSPFDPSKMTHDQMAGQSHLIGLAFSRAAAMLTIANALPPNDPRVPVFRRLAAIHAVQGYKTLDEAGYLETHWIATYALMYELAGAPHPAVGAAVAAR
ncbi:MAG TPA: DUF2891 family protein [Terriglobales bacterium]|nr:DUF2891 family protein [Terriglobales bacterium]